MVLNYCEIMIFSKINLKIIRIHVNTYIFYYNLQNFMMILFLKFIKFMKIHISLEILMFTDI